MKWNAGGWFGGQLGATCWMLVAAVLTAPRDASAALIVLALFAVPNAVGIALWSSRRISCYASTQVLLATAGICGVLAVRTLGQAGNWSEIQSGGSVSTTSTYWIILLTFGGLMLVFHFRFGRPHGSRVAMRRKP